MAEKFVDRQSTYPNRYKITREDGTTEYVIMVRADEPTVDGTPLNARKFNDILDELDGKVNKAGGAMTGGLVIPYVHIVDANYPQMVFGDPDSITGYVYQNAGTGEVGFRQMKGNHFDDLLLLAPAESLGGNSRHTIYTSRDPLILQKNIHYGDTLPAPGVPGRIFFKKVT